MFPQIKFYGNKTDSPQNLTTGNLSIRALQIANKKFDRSPYSFWSSATLPIPTLLMLDDKPMKQLAVPVFYVKLAVNSFYKCNEQSKRRKQQIYHRC